MTDKNTALLPSGFEDLLYPDAGQEASGIRKLMDVFQAFGYERVKPPYIEFEESLLGAGPGVSFVDHAFRLMDPVSRQMMALRPDITAQIARLASARLTRAARPLRLAYSGSVFRMQSSQQRTDRQFQQVGCEIIGHEEGNENAIQADIEISVLPLLGLSKLGIGELTLDFNIPGFLVQIFEEYGCTSDDVQRFKEALNKRDSAAVKAVDGKIAGILEALLDVTGSAEDVIVALGALDISEAARGHISRLNVVYNGTAQALKALGLDDVSLSVDPTQSKGFEYHNGICFAVFSNQARAELGRGGRYDVERGQGESAAGFSLYIDTVRRAMPALEPSKRVFVPYGESWGVIKALQDEGWITQRGSSINKDDPNDGRDACSHEYIDGEVKAIS